MAVNKYLHNNNGIATEQTAPVASAGAGDAGKLPALDASGRLDPTVMPTGIGADTSSITASEALSAGDFVNVWNSAGNPRVRKADASTTGKHAHGFVIAAVANAAAATVFFEGTNAQVTGQTAGDVYLSATTPGASTSTPPTGSGQIVQPLGVAVAAAAINVEIDRPIVLA